MRFFRHLVATLCFGALGLSAAPAHALGILTFSPPTWTNRVDGRPINVLNRKDCLDDATASFSYSVKGTSGGVFEVWSGANCDNKDNRSATAVSKTCAKVATGSTLETRIDLHFREMVKTYGAEDDAGIAACDTPQGAGLQTRALYFVVYNLNDFTSLATSVPVSWQFKYDIQAPPAPSNVSAVAGDRTLVTRFTPPTGETNLLNYRFYCSPQGSPPVTGTAGTSNGGTAATDTAGTAGTDAGTGGTAGTDTGGTAGTDTGGTAGTDTGGTAATHTGGTAGTDTGGTAGGTAGTDTSTSAGTAGTPSTNVDPNCTSTTLVPGQPVPAGAMECGTIGALTSKGGETDAVLENEGQYAVAIATEDDANNVGLLSSLACGTPRDVAGFYEAYDRAGGQAGGGFCTFAPARRDAMAMGIALLLGACAFWRRRR